MEHERFAPLLYRIVLAGLMLGVMVLIQAATGCGAATSPLLMIAVGIAPPVLVAIFFLRIVLSCSLDRHRLSTGIGVVILVVVVLQLTLLIVAGASDGPRTVTVLTLLFTKFAYTLLVAVVLAAYTGHRLNQTYGLLAALLFLATPPLLAPFHAEMLSLYLVFYWTSALFCLLLWGETRKIHWLVTGGLCMGFAGCGMPWDTALISLVLGLGILVFLIRHIRRQDGTVGYVALFVLGSVIPFAGWTAISYSISGDVSAGTPFSYSAADTQGLRDVLAEDASVMGVVESISQSILLVPRSGELLPPAWSLGPLAVCFLPWAFKGKWGYEKRTLLAVAVMVLAFVSYAGELKTLGFLPIIPLLAVLGTFGIHNLYMNVRRPALLFSTVLVLLVWNTIVLWK